MQARIFAVLIMNKSGYVLPNRRKNYSTVLKTSK